MTRELTDLERKWNFRWPSDVEIGDQVKIIGGFDVNGVLESHGVVDEIMASRISVRLNQSGRSAWIHHELLILEARPGSWPLHGLL
jgi:hypothetical protein